MSKKLLLIAATLLCAASTPACVIHDDDGHGHGYDDDGSSPSDQQAFYTTIDADHFLDTDLGDGAGMFVEYNVGGRWTLWTSCDSNFTGSLCNWEAHVTAQQGSITDVLEFDTEGGDFVEYFGDNGLSFYAETGQFSDSVEFYAEPGTLLEIQLVLDGYSAPGYFVWYGNGYVHDGADGTPVVFQPDQP